MKKVATKQDLLDEIKSLERVVEQQTVEARALKQEKANLTASMGHLANRKRAAEDMLARANARLENIAMLARRVE